jgi:hypothetical protein
VIKAIQTLSQVTLNEVIENLAALRDGKAPSSSSSEGGASARPTSSTKQQTARVAETPSAPETKAASPEPSQIDHKEVWRKTVEKVRATRKLISGWVDAGTALGIEGRFLVVGFPPDHKTAMESLSIPRTREFLEALVKEISGQDWKIKFVLKEGLPVVTPTEPTAPKKPEDQATFKDDPLIREALEIFKGEIKTASD